MYRRTRAITTLPLLLGLALTGAACSGPGGSTRDTDEAAATAAESAATIDESRRTNVTADTSGTRGALPSLFSIMLGLQGDLDRISHGLWIENYESIASAAESVADHPAIPPEEGAIIAEVLGPDMARFQALDREVHDLSVQLADHARARDLQAALNTDARLRAGCVECHTAFRDRLREGVGR